MFNATCMRSTCGWPQDIDSSSADTRIKSFLQQIALLSLSHFISFHFALFSFRAGRAGIRRLEAWGIMNALVARSLATIRSARPACMGVFPAFPPSSPPLSTNYSINSPAWCDIFTNYQASGVLHGRSLEWFMMCDQHLQRWIMIPASTSAPIIVGNRHLGINACHQ